MASIAKTGLFRRMMPWLLPIVVILLAYMAGSGRADLDGALEARKIEITAYPLSGFSLKNPEQKQIGSLTFLRGAELISSDPGFGGLSGFKLLPNNRFVAVTDTGDLVSGSVSNGDGPIAVEGASIAPVRLAGGKRAKDMGLWDIESLACTVDGRRAAVGIERRHTLLVFDDGDMPLSRPGRQVPLPGFVGAWPTNRGIEALGFLPEGTALAGRLIGISERSGQADEPTQGFVMKDDGTEAFQIRIRRRNGFDVTDLDFLPDGDLVLLERFFSPIKGVGMQLRRIAHTEIKPDAVLDGEVLISVMRGLTENSYAIDNMEGLSIRPQADGTVRMAIVSDNNFSIAQRTLYLEFAYRP
jgi:hypothetical protein